MRAVLLVLFAAAVLIGVSGIPKTSRVFAQQAAQTTAPGKQPLPAPGQFKNEQARGGRGHTPTFAGPPAGTQPLPIDLFTSKNFYKDQKYWTNKYYYRCNTVRQLTDMWTAERTGNHPPQTAAWGDCNLDVPREKVVSQYPYKTAQEHYEALLAAAKAKGGPTVYTKATLPDWDGYYQRDQSADHGAEWYWGNTIQAPTMLSLITAEYQRRWVQMDYHEAADNSPQWNASFCYPEGFLRLWEETSGAGNFQLTMNTSNIQILAGTAANFLRQILVGQQKHVQKVPQWYGETIGFWDGTTLVTWTSNVQTWTTHTMFEYSDKLETIETFKPAYDANGKFVGLDHDAVWYDPVAFVQPLHASYRYARKALLNDASQRYTYIECLSNIRNVNGRPTQITNSDPRYVDYYGRPWAQVWEKWFEVGWDKPKESRVPADIENLLK